MEMEEILSNLESICGMVSFLDIHQNAFPVMNDKKVSDVLQESIDSLEKNYISIDDLVEIVHEIFDPEENYPIKEKIVELWKKRKEEK